MYYVRIVTNIRISKVTFTLTQVPVRAYSYEWSSYE